MSLDASALFEAVRSHALATGLFDRVNTHEPANAPGNGVTAAIAFMRLGPVAAASGLDVASARLELAVRVYNPELQMPYDDIDPAVLNAASILIGVYAGDFTLDGIARDVDIFGAHGAGLDSRAGFVPIDGTQYRTVTITLPIIINDLWDEAP